MADKLSIISYRRRRRRIRIWLISYPRWICVLIALSSITSGMSSMKEMLLLISTNET